jgi:hypothetical protein
MIENLLLLSDTAVSLACGAANVSVSAMEVSQHLDNIAQALRSDEIRIRIEEAVGFRRSRFRPQSLERASAALDELREEVAHQLAEAAKRETEIAAAVDAMLKDGSYRRQFRGKPMLSRFYEVLRIAAKGIGVKEFAMLLAREAAADSEVRKLVDDVEIRVQNAVKASAAGLPAT